MRSEEILNTNIETEGKNAVKIKEYIKNQLKQDEIG